MIRKPLKVIVWCIGIVAIVSICSWYVADYAVIKVMDILVMESDETDSTAVQEDIAKLPAKEENNQEPAKVKQPLTKQRDRSNSSSVPDDDKLIEDEVASSEKDENKVSSSKTTGTVSKQKVKHVQESLTTADKAKIITIMTGSVTLSNAEKLLDMAKGGLTVAEKQQAKELLLVTLSPEDYNVLSALAKKYGISRGKTYDESKKELNL